MSEILGNALWWSFSGFVVLWAARRPAGTHAGLGSPLRLARRVVPALAVLYAAWLILLTWTRHRSLQTYGCDLGIFDNVLWNTVHGRFLHSAVLNRHFFGEHASPILLALAPLYALWPDARLLLAVQAAALAWAALPIYRMAARRLGPTAGVLTLFMYFSYVPLEGVYLFDFHEVALAIPLLAYAVEHLVRGHFRRMLLFLGLALLCKEELALTVAAFGLVLASLPRSAGPLPATLSAAPRRKLGVAMVLAGGVLFLFLTGWVVPYFRQAPFPYVDRYSHLGGTLPGIAWTALTDPVRVLKSIGEPAKLVFLRGLSSPVLYLNWFSPVAVLLSLPTLARSLLSNHAPQYALQFHFLGPLVPFVFYGAASGLGGLLRRRWPGDAGPARRRAARRARLQIALLLLFGFGVVRGSHPGVLWNWAQNGLERRGDLEAVLRQIPSDASVCAHNHLVPQISNRRDVSVFPDARDFDWVLLDFGRPGTEYPLSREEHVRRFLRLARAGGYGIRARAGKFVLLRRGRSGGDLDLETVVRALFLEYGSKECVHISARQDPETLQWFPEIDLVADWLFPAGEYRARYEVQARRPRRSADRFTLLAHPRWGEFTGRWTVADRVVTAADFGGDPMARKTFDLEFRNPTPALLSLQTVGAKSAGVKVRRIVLEPLFPMSEFVEQMVRIHECAPAE